MTIIRNVRLIPLESSANQAKGKGSAPMPGSLEIPDLERFCNVSDLKDFVQGIGEDLEEAEKVTWINLCALGLFSYPTGQVKYSTEKELAGFLGVDLEVLISTIEKAQARKKSRWLTRP
jgi:hypothetical protein